MQAVTSLVYSHTHVVRLRVTSGSTVLADVGGPYIIAPVGGTPALPRRARSGTTSLSVQDDLGYVKLETRFIGAPLVLHVGVDARARRRHARARARRASPSTARSATTACTTRRSRSTARPSRAARCASRCSLPAPPASSAMSCAAIRHRELTHIAQLAWRRFELDGAPPYGVRQRARAYRRAQLRARGLAPARRQHQPWAAPPARRGPLSYHGRRYTLYLVRGGGHAGHARLPARPRPGCALVAVPAAASRRLPGAPLRSPGQRFEQARDHADRRLGLPAVGEQALLVEPFDQPQVGQHACGSSRPRTSASAGSRAAPRSSIAAELRVGLVDGDVARRAAATGRRSCRGCRGGFSALDSAPNSLITSTLPANVRCHRRQARAHLGALAAAGVSLGWSYQPV